MMSFPFGLLVFALILAYWTQRDCVKSFVRKFLDEEEKPTEAVEPVTSNVSAPSPKEYTEELQKLESLGFMDESRNHKFLEQFGGNVRKTISALLK